MTKLYATYIRAHWLLHCVCLLAIFSALSSIFLAHSLFVLLAFLTCVTLTWVAGSTRAFAYAGFRFSLGLSFSSGDARTWVGRSKNSEFDAARILADVPVCHRTVALWSLLTGTLVNCFLVAPLLWWIKAPAAYLAWRITKRLRIYCADIERAEAQRARNERASQTLDLLRIGKVGR